MTAFDKARTLLKAALKAFTQEAKHMNQDDINQEIIRLMMEIVNERRANENRT